MKNILKISALSLMMIAPINGSDAPIITIKIEDGKKVVTKQYPLKAPLNNRFYVRRIVNLGNGIKKIITVDPVLNTLTDININREGEVIQTIR